MSHLERKKVVQALDTQILYLQQIRNVFIPVGAIPSEILLQIFMQLRSDIASEPASSIGNPYVWIRVSHVCRHWRQVALGAPRLWTTVWIPSTPACLKEVLSRSQTLPLTIRPGKAHRRLDASSIYIVLRELPRIDTFDAQVPTQFSIAGNTHTAIELRVKEINLFSELSGNSRNTTGIYYLYHYLVQFAAPSLRSLTLRCNNFMWKKLHLPPTLTHLTLSTDGCHSSRGIDMHYMVDCLESATSLENIELNYCMSAPPDHISARPVIKLHHLRRLCVSSDAATLSLFLRCLTIPTDAIKKYTVYYGVEEDMNALLSQMKGCVAGYTHRNADYHPSSLCTIDLRTTLPRGCMALKGWSIPIAISALIETPESIPEPLLTLVVRLQPNQNFSAISLLRAIPFTDVVTALVAGGYCMLEAEKSEWTEAFANSSNLKELALGEFAANHVQQILRQRIQDGDPARKILEQPNLRNLETLHLQHSFSDFNDTILDELSLTLKRWKECGVGLRNLRIAGLPQDLPAMLQSAVYSLHIQENCSGLLLVVDGCDTFVGDPLPLLIDPDLSTACERFHAQISEYM